MAVSSPASGRVFAGRALAAVRAAGVGGDGGAGEGQHGGEADLAGRQAGGGGGAGGEPGDHVVREQQRPGFLAGSAAERPRRTRPVPRTVLFR